ncbi:MAG: hypothetical protein SP4CHLAM5_11840 [Chlamydiia bacterium]|nr:hypothetical protein [Chlamydiia bacterium]MCH9624794.1 hypothetical protein [Chlamydiia bacterium]
MKKWILAIFFLFALHIHADNEDANLTVILYRGVVCSVTINVDTIENNLDFDQAERLIGTGSQYYYLGSLTMSIFNNNIDYPHNLDIQCTTYDSANNEFVAIHTNSTSEIVIGVQKNFDLQGDSTPYAYIDPVGENTTIRTIDALTCPEHHTLFFYIKQSANNTFVKGVYTAHFTLLFES